MVEFGWSVGCIIAAIETGNKIRKALGDANGAKDHFRDTISFLEQSDSVLKELERHIRDSPTSRYQDAITQQLKLIEKPWTRLQVTLAEYEDNFGDGMSKSRIKRISGTVRWVLKDLDEAVRSAKAEVLGPLNMINCLLQVHSLETIRDTNDKCQRMMEDLEIADLTNAVRAAFDNLSLTVATNRAEQTEIVRLIRQLHLLLAPQKSELKEVLEKSDDILCNLSKVDTASLDQQQMIITSLSQHLMTFMTQNTTSYEDIHAKLRSQQENLKTILEAIETLTTEFKVASLSLPAAEIPTERSINAQEAIALLKLVVTASSMFVIGYSARSRTSTRNHHVQSQLRMDYQAYHISDPKVSNAQPIHKQPSWASEFNHSIQLSQQESANAHQGSRTNKDNQANSSPMATTTSISETSTDYIRIELWHCCDCKDSLNKGWRINCRNCDHLMCGSCDRRITRVPKMNKKHESTDKRRITYRGSYPDDISKTRDL